MMADDQSGWQHIGAHLFRIEEPDVFFLRVSGDVSGAQMRRMLDEVDRFATGKTRIFWIADASRLGDMSLEARKIAAQADTATELVGAVVFGTSFQQRLMTKLLVKSAALFRKNTVPVEFTADEEGARAWVAAQRLAAPRGEATAAE